MKSKNLTLSIEEDLLREAKRYVARRGVSLNAMIRDYLRTTVLGKRGDETANEFLAALSAAEGCSNGREWKREDAYEE